MKNKRYLVILVMNVIVAVMGVLFYFTKKKSQSTPDINEHIKIRELRLLTPIDHMEDILSKDYIPMEGFGCIIYENRHEDIQLIFGGYPDVQDTYRLIEIATTNSKYSFYGIRSGDSLNEADTILQNNKYSIKAAGHYILQDINFYFNIDEKNNISSIRVKYHQTNQEGVLI